MTGSLLAEGLLTQVQPLGWITYWLLNRWFTTRGHEQQRLGLNRGPSGAGQAKVSVYIGILERLIIFAFVWHGAYEATSFTITGKALLRFREANEERHSEYILVGTLLSSACAILSALALRGLAVVL